MGTRPHGSAERFVLQSRLLDVPDPTKHEGLLEMDVSPSCTRTGTGLAAESHESVAVVAEGLVGTGTTPAEGNARLLCDHLPGRPRDPHEAPNVQGSVGAYFDRCGIVRLLVGQ